MRIVARYASPLLAEAAAEFLRQSSIAARSMGRLGGDGIMGTTGGGVFEVAVLVNEQASPARELLQRFNESKPELDPDWEQTTEPDLTKLDPRHRPVCPTCGRLIAVRPDLSACPSCSAPADLLELIVEQHGPDALAPCYTDQAQDLPDDLIESAPLSCPTCHCPLDGLEPEGICPECGAAYSKPDLLRGRG